MMQLIPDVQLYVNACIQLRVDVFQHRLLDQLSRNSELPVFDVFNGLDSPVEFLAQRLRKELLDWNVELLGEHDSKTRINVVL